MTQNIKPNDLVYIPYLSTRIFTATHSYHSKLCVVYEEEEFDFLPSGKLDHNDVVPLVYLATPENKIKLEEFYGITLEDIPVDEELEDFCKEIDLLLKAQKELSSIPISTDYSQPDSRQTKRNTLANQIINHKENLIRMFKE